MPMQARSALLLVNALPDDVEVRLDNGARDAYVLTVPSGQCVPAPLKCV